MRKITRMFFAFLLLMIAGVMSVHAEKLYADLSKYTNNWDAGNSVLSFQWTATYGNQLQPELDLPKGDLRSWEKLVVVVEELNNCDFFRILVYNPTEENSDFSNTLKANKTGVNEFTLAGNVQDLSNVARIVISGSNWEDSKNSTWNTTPASIKVKEVYLERSDDPLALPKDNLSKALNKGKMISSLAYTDASFAILTNAITAGDAALVADEATTESLSTALTDINNAIEALVFKEGFSSLQDVPFGTWNGWGADAEFTQQVNPTWELFKATGQSYGDPSVNNRADLSAYDKLYVVTASGTPRILLNRDVAEGQWNENEAESHLIDNTKGGWSARYFSTEDKVYIVDLKQLTTDKGFAHLTAIKSYDNNVVTGLYLYKAPAVVPAEPTVVTWDATAQNYENATEVGTVAIDEKISAIFDKNTNTNAPKYYTNGTAVRVYAGNTITISGEKVAISKIEFTFGEDDGDNTIKASKGTLTDGVWTIEENTNFVKFTIDGTKGQRRIAGIKVTYTIDENAAPLPQPVHIANTAETAYTVAKAIELIDAGEALSETVFVKGIVSQVDKIQSGAITYWISDDGTTTKQFECYKGKNIDGADFAAIDDVKVGAEVIVKGTMTKYQETYEFSANNELVSYKVPVELFAGETGKYFLCNTASEKFFGAGNSWGTQASLLKNPDFVTLIKQPDGTYQLESQVSNGGNAYYFNGSYMDNASPVALTIAKIAEPFGYKDEAETIPVYAYTIATGENYYGWDGTTTVLASNLTADSENASWLIFTEEEVMAALNNATVEDPIDATFLITDHTFGRNHRNVDAWTNEGGAALTGGNSNKHTAEKYHGAFNVYQKLTNAPAGIYKFTAQGFYRQDGTDEENLPVFYANNVTSQFPVKTGTENSMADACASFEAGLYAAEPIYVQVTEAGELTVGAKLETNGTLWCIWDNFELFYYGNEATIEQVKNASIIAELQELRTKAGEKINAVEVEVVKTAIQDALTATADVDTSDAEALKTAIATLKAAIEKADVHIAAKTALDGIANVMAGTNVYTAEAFETYNGIYETAKGKYEAGELTKADAIENPESLLGWHVANNVDDLLLSAWTIGETQCKDYDAGMYINTWSVEGESDGSNFKVPFFEYWTADANSLEENTLTATMTNIPEGDYDVTAWVRVRIKNGAEAPATGITLQANEGEAVNVCDGEALSPMYVKEVTATGTVAEDGVLKIKFNVAADNNISWLSFKNVKFEKKPEFILTLKGTVGEETTLTFGVYDAEDTFTVDFGGEDNTQTAKVGIDNKGPVKEDGTTASATKFTGTVAGDGTIKVYGNNDIWYLVTTNGTMPTTLDQPKLMNVVQMSITGADVESVALPAYPKMTQFSFNNSSAKSVDVTKVPTLTSLTINSTTASKFEPQLESIDLSKNTELAYLSLQGNKNNYGKLTTLDLTNNTKLDGMGLYVQYNALTEIKFGENTLSAINVQDNQLTSLDWTKLTGLKNLYASNNKLAGEADLSANAKFENVQLNNNELTSVKLPDVTKQLAIQDNKFTLATLPSQPAGLNTKSKTGKFTYAPQAALEVPETVSELDLTSQLTVAQGELDPADYATYLTATTTFGFVTENGTALVEGTDYEVTEPGKFKFLTAQEEKVHGVMLNAAFPKFTEAVPFITTEFTVEAAAEEVLDPDLVEIPQDQGKTLDTFARAELVEGESYNIYTANEDLTVAFKMYDIDVKNCDYVVVKFAEPVPAGWNIAFWAQGGTDNVAIPEGATEYKYIFAEDEKCAIKDDVLPQICVLTLWGAQKPLVMKVKGIYKHQVPVEIAHTWNFTKWSEATVANLKAEAAKVTVEADPDKEGNTMCTDNGALWSDHEKTPGKTCDTYAASKDNCFWYIGGEAEPKANDEVIAEFAGLEFNTAYGASRALAIAVNYPSTSLGTYNGPAYLWFGGKNQTIMTIKNVKAGTTIKMGVESHKPAEARGVKLLIGETELTDPEGAAVAAPTTYTEQTWAVPAGDGVVDVVVKNTNGCHIYFIDAEIGEPLADGINSIAADRLNGTIYNMNGQKVNKAQKGLYIINGKKVFVK